MLMYSAIILTGGKSRRFGSDKSHASIGQKSLIEELLTSLSQDLDIVIVGPRIENASRALRYAQENPLGGGPVAAISAGLDFVQSEFVAIIATDMPFASRIIDFLGRATPFNKDALIPLDALGLRQPLCAMYRVASLRKALTTLGSVESRSMRNLVQLMVVQEVRLTPELERILIDIDTPSDLERAITLKAANKKG